MQPTSCRTRRKNRSVTNLRSKTLRHYLKVSRAIKWENLSGAYQPSKLSCRSWIHLKFPSVPSLTIHFKPIGYCRWIWASRSIWANTAPRYRAIGMVLSKLSAKKKSTYFCSVSTALFRPWSSPAPSADWSGTWEICSGLSKATFVKKNTRFLPWQISWIRKKQSCVISCTILIACDPSTNATRRK